MQNQHENSQVASIIGEAAFHSVESMGDSPVALTSPRVNVSAASAKNKFHFRSMFNELDPASFEDKDLVELGLLMEAGPDLGDHPILPAGYTYLGQFIAHDISFINHNNIPPRPIPLDQIGQLRHPSLDLGSLYGDGPDVDGPDIYQADRASLKLGHTSRTGTGVTAAPYENDLFRQTDRNKPGYRQAIIADERNDDNLIVAQTHVAFTKFHNAVIDMLRGKGVSGADLFLKAREKVVQHYQWIILDDFLPKIIDRTLLGETIREYPQKTFLQKPDQEIFIPAEFAFAAFRFGHSLIRSAYSWNNHVQRPPGLIKLIEMTGKNGNLENADSLPSDWIIDWTRFYDFSRFGIAPNPNSNKARKIQTSLVRSFKDLRERNPRFLNQITPEEYRPIAALDLIRGSRAGLPSGQAVAQLLTGSQLKPEQIAGGPHQSFLSDHGFDRQTPLWYYILKEAEINPANQLGPVGGRLVAETIVGLIRASRFSILPQSGGEPVWKPDLGQITPQKFDMPDLLMFVRKNSNQRCDELNPLGP